MRTKQLRWRGFMDTGKIKKTDPDRKFRRVLSASSLAGDRVKTPEVEDLGKVHDLMSDIPTGRVAYIVLSYGGVLGMGNKLFAIPWNAVQVDEDDKSFILDIDEDQLETAPGFDKDNWPDMADLTWGESIYRFYGTRPHWEAGEAYEERRFRGGGGM